MANSNDMTDDGMPPQTLWARRLKEVMPDSPTMPNEHLRAAALIAYMTILPQARARELKAVYNHVLGPERIKSSIMDGETPEGLAVIRIPLYQIHALVQETIEASEALTMGLSLALVHAQLQVAAQVTASSSPEDACIKEVELLKSLFRRLESKAPQRALTLPPLDYSSVYAFVEGQKNNGSLSGDPAWEDDFSSKKRTNRSTWKQRLESNLEIARKMLEVIIADNPAMATPPDQRLIALSMESDLRIAMTKWCKEKPVSLPSTFASECSLADTILDLRAYTDLSVELRSDLVESVKKVGNQHFNDDNLDKAEMCYETAVVANTNDPAPMINLLAVGLKRTPKTKEILASMITIASACMAKIALTAEVAIIDGEKSGAFLTRRQERSTRMKSMIESWNLFTAVTHCKPFAMSLQSSESEAPSHGVAKSLLDNVNMQLHRVTRSFTCSHDQMDNLEWKLHLRFARVFKEVADFTARIIEKKEKSKGPGLSASQLAEVEREIEVYKHDRAQSLQRAKYEYGLAIQIDPHHLQTRLELERLQLDIDECDFCNRMPPF